MSGHPLTEILLSNSDESEEDLQEILNEVEVEEELFTEEEEKDGDKEPEDGYPTFRPATFRPVTFHWTETSDIQASKKMKYVI